MLSLRPILIALCLLSACGKASFSGSNQRQGSPANPATPPTEECPAALAAPANCHDLTREPPAPEAPLPANTKPPRFAFLVNDPQCSFCHLKVNGDVVSITPVNGVRKDSVAQIRGHWYAASTWQALLDADQGSAQKPNIQFENGGQLHTNYRGPEMPHAADGTPAFPVFNSADVASAASGRLMARNERQEPVLVNKNFQGNVVFIGTQANPIEIQGDVYVSGDVIIKGFYKGIGTIYTDGNIYIPSDLRALNSAFPFAPDAQTASDQARAAMDQQKDALGLATQKSIFMGDLEMTEPSSVVDTPRRQRNAFTIYTSPETPANRNNQALLPLAVYDWIGSKAAYAALYERAYQCANLPPLVGETPRRTAGLSSFSLIEAFLYARNTVAGVARRNSYTINGGIIADHMHIISGAGLCESNAAHPVSQSPMQSNYLNYDHRMRLGLPILHHISDYFTANDEP